MARGREAVRREASRVSRVQQEARHEADRSIKVAGEVEAEWMDRADRGLKEASRREQALLEWCAEEEFCKRRFGAAFDYDYREPMPVPTGIGEEIQGTGEGLGAEGTHAGYVGSLGLPLTSAPLPPHALDAKAIEVAVARCGSGTVSVVETWRCRSSVAEEQLARMSLLHRADAAVDTISGSESVSESESGVGGLKHCPRRLGLAGRGRAKSSRGGGGGGEEDTARQRGGKTRGRGRGAIKSGRGVDDEAEEIYDDEFEDEDEDEDGDRDGDGRGDAWLWDRAGARIGTQRAPEQVPEQVPASGWLVGRSRDVSLVLGLGNTEGPGVMLEAGVVYATSIEVAIEAARRGRVGDVLSSAGREAAPTDGVGAGTTR